MNSKPHILFGLLFVILFGSSFSSDPGRASENVEKPAAKTRSFYMGMTPQPYDITPEALNKTYEIIHKHTDMITHHFDNGIPWQESLEKDELPAHIGNDIQFRLDNTLPSQKVFLALTPIASRRDKLADIWGPFGSLDRTGAWAKRDFDSPKVVKAYRNFCMKMIDFFEPDYLAYGIEVNLLIDASPEGFDKFVKLAKKTYTTLKRKYPELPIFLTFFMGPKHVFEIHMEGIQRLLPYTDYLAMSTYPFLSEGVNGNPGSIDKDWFSRLRDLAPQKPFAIAETTFIAEELVFETLGFTVPGSSQWQTRYVKRLFRDMQRLDAEFVVWFVPVDYDALWIWMEQSGIDEIFKAWRDSGLFDQNLKPRRALKIWDKWLKRKRIGSR